MFEHSTPGSRRDAFEVTALAHFDTVYNVAMSFTRNPAEAQDLVQETYCKAYRFFYRFQPGTHMKAWLVTILRNTFINTCRKASRQPERVELEQIAPFHAAPSRTPEWTEEASVEAFLRHEVQDEVKQAIDALPEAFRLAVILADLAECSSNEIATILGLPGGDGDEPALPGTRTATDAPTNLCQGVWIYLLSAPPYGWPVWSESSV